MKLTLKKFFYVFLLVLVFPLGTSGSFAATSNQSFISDLKARIKEAYNVDPKDITVEWKDDDISKKIAELQKFYPGKSITLEVKDSVIKDISGKQGIPVDVFVDNKQNRIIYLRCKFDVLKDAIVAKYDIKRGETVTSENIKYYKVPVQKLIKAITPSSTENIIGKMAMTDILENTVITSNLLKEKTVVFRGNQVTIRVRNGDLILTGVGEALQDGFIGQSIRVKVTSFTSKQTVMAKVLDVSLVEINLGGSN